MKSNPRFRGPSLLLLATVHLLLFAAGLVAAAVLRHGARFATPFAPAEELRAFLALSQTAVRVSNFFLFGSAVPFGIFAVTTVSRMRYLGVRAAGTNIALLGGLIATLALILSGECGMDLVCAGSAGLRAAGQDGQFPQLPVRGDGLCGWIRPSGRGCFGHLLLHAASPAMAGRLRNAHGAHGRALFPQPGCVSGKLLYPHHPVPGPHLDVCRRRGTDPRSQRRAGRRG